ncbi:type VII secretion integral membrane protein EccD [Mycobacterium angelicum]|uniref:Type VII secretion integral membrane protein EccD n=1 Tax=Mycobacterium angelicum TaxID=470074 RepID=A0A1W9ZWW5_MYCAN|nr:type VII secretion integral membrane protein EccD [Mycobacterium angelicum]MCV7199734.1 type VII secretion integral membrane protein EccD [Mycobacterium angelicum]ORA22234.1 type VII secretion integral membrane protein EccD [Mycobacterium angelicum]
MSTSEPGLRRVAVHAGTTALDLSLPAGIPVATLIPSIIDILGTPSSASRYQLSLLGAPALPNSTTLAQNGIRDGAVLVLSQAAAEPPVRHCDDTAEAVSAALSSAVDRRTTRRTGAIAALCLSIVGVLVLVTNGPGDKATAGVAAAASVGAIAGAAFARRAYRDQLAALTLGLVAIVFAAVAGWFTVPGCPGSAHLLLTATTVAATSVAVMRLTGGSAITLTAITCAAAVVAFATLIGVLAAAPPGTIGCLATLTAVGVMELSPRISIKMAGLSPREDALPTADLLGAKARGAEAWLTGLLAGCAASAAIGAIAAALADRHAVAESTVTAALLLLRARSGPPNRALTFAAAGIATGAATFAAAMTGWVKHGPWITAVTAVLAAAAFYLGFVAPTMPLSPVARRGVEILECLALVAVVPLTCWVCGVFSAVFGLDLI